MPRMGSDIRTSVGALRIQLGVKHMQRAEAVHHPLEWYSGMEAEEEEINAWKDSVQMVYWESTLQTLEQHNARRWATKSLSAICQFLLKASSSGAGL
ncbi:hypothetical protein NDU88_003470 [Pleurodeles waltl]|uniref:Uncharacterized protein n=1 Tax=Pleurodeles waltl TaxID=8319 RepID=A0AAV7V1D8_PLEWA|nr:hypothetical protein NDU88_003470 [Pleurodeles waltl]